MASIGVWELDLATNELWWSDEVYRIFEIDPTRFEASYEAFLELVHPEDRDAVDSAYSGSIETGAAYETVHRIVTRSGCLKYLHEHCRHECDDKGKPIRSIGTVQDISERTRLEHELVQTQKLASIGQLATGVAHEFNNLMMVINGNVHAALRPGLDRRQISTALETIYHACRNGAKLTDRLLSYGRQQSLLVEPVDLNHFVLASEPLFSAALGRSNVLRLETAETSCIVDVDKGQLEAALLNLVTNARDAMEHGGTVVLRVVADSATRSAAEPDSRWVTITVRDTGVGMNAESLRRATDPFFTTKPPGQGTGLGLSMVRGFVEQSNGRLEIDSSPEQGTTVTLSFVASLRAPEATKQVVGRLLETPAAKRLLLVEDDPLLRDTTERLLEAMSFSVVVASDGDRALRVLASDPTIDALLADVVMPSKTDGLDLAAIVLRDHPEVRVVMMSGKPIDLSRLPEGDASRVGCLRKPFDPKQLLAVLASDPVTTGGKF